jgi:glycosyltransferase involved in cell wall biosynthesis
MALAVAHSRAGAASPVIDPPEPSDTRAALSVVGIDPELGFGGGESQVLGLTIELLRAGNRAELLCDPDGQLWKRARSAAIVCHPLRIRNALDFAAGMRLRAFLRRGRYDIVHFHTSRAHSLAPFARRYARKLFVTRRMDYRPNRLFAPWLYNHAVDAVVAISAAVAEALAGAGVKPQRVTIIPSGVDCERFRPPAEGVRTQARAALGLTPDEIAIGTVGALEHRKGHRHLLEAIAALGASTQDARAMRLKCFVAGDGSLRADLDAEVRRLGLEPFVRLMGRLDDPRALLWALDIFVLPSLNEGLGVALLEAMACGLPVVASDTAGPKEVIEQEHSGLLFRPGSSAELAQALRRVMETPGMRIAIGGAARDRIVEGFTMETMATRTLELYRGCLGSGTPSVGRG